MAGTSDPPVLERLDYGLCSATYNGFITVDPMRCRIAYIYVPSAIVILLAAWWACFEIKLAPIVCSEAVRMQARKYEPAQAAGKEVLFQLESARLSLPTDLVASARPVAAGGWQFSDRDEEKGLFVGAPTRRPSAEYASLRTALLKLGIEAPINSDLDATRLIISAQPVSFLDLFRFGKTKFEGLLTVAALKSVMLSGVNGVAEYQRGEYRFVVLRSRQRNLTLVYVCQRTTGWSDWAAIKFGDRHEKLYIDSVLRTFTFGRS